MRALLLTSVLLFCALVLMPPPVHASTMDDIARFFGFGGGGSGDRATVSATRGGTQSGTLGIAGGVSSAPGAGGDAPVVSGAAAPEIDGNAVASAVALALGGLAAFGVRRRRG